MKTYQIEINRYHDHFKKMNDHLNSLNLDVYFDLLSNHHIPNGLTKIRKFPQENFLIHFFLQLLPVIFLLILFYLSFLTLPYLSTVNLKIIYLSIAHGILSYQFVVYTLHEGAGHGLFKKISVLNKISFHLSRIFFADPSYYKTRHQKHHLNLGHKDDGAFSHYVLPHRILKSMMPGAGILFKNDYKIAQGDTVNSSHIISIITGLCFLFLQVYLIQSIDHHFSLTAVLLCLLIFSPWVAMLLDRARESYEHWMMPNHRSFGSWEMGYGIFGLIIGGGPWGQPCHFTHHLAPDLNWYQQLWLHQLISKWVRRNNQVAKFSYLGFHASNWERLKKIVIFYFKEWDRESKLWGFIKNKLFNIFCTIIYGIVELFLYFQKSTKTIGPITTQNNPELLQSIFAFRRQQNLNRNINYLENGNQQKIEHELDLDNRSYHFVLLSKSNQDILCCIRITPAPFEISKLVTLENDNELDHILHESSEYYEFSRLISETTLSNKRSHVFTLMLHTGHWLFKKQKAKGIIAICKIKLLPFFEGYGLKPVLEKNITIKERDGEYNIIRGDILSVLQAIYLLLMQKSKRNKKNKKT